VPALRSGDSSHQARLFLGALRLIKIVITLHFEAYPENLANTHRLVAPTNHGCEAGCKLTELYAASGDVPHTVRGDVQDTVRDDVPDTVRGDVQNTVRDDVPDTVRGEPVEP